MRRVILAAMAAAALLASAPARADVVHRASASGAGTGSTLTVPLTVPAGDNRLLAVAVSTAGTGVTGVTYGQQTLTQRFVQPGTASAVYIFTLVAPNAGSGDVTVTGDAGDKVVGASVFTGVDQANPVIQARGQARNDTGQVDSVQLAGTVPGDAIFGAITVGTAANAGGFTTRAFADDVVPSIRWNLRSGNVRGSGATRSGNHGTNPDAYILWQWSAGNFMTPTARATAGIALRRAAPAILPTVTTGAGSGITRTTATLAGNVTSDGEGELTQRGVAFCLSPCTPEVGAPGTSVALSAGQTGAFTVTAAGLEPRTLYTYRAFATNAAGVGYGLAGGFVTLVDQPPASTANGPYTVAEGGAVSFSAAGSADPEGDPITYSWDINGDGTYGDAAGASPTLTWAALNALGITDGPATHDVRVRVSDVRNPATVSAATALTVTNAAPAATADIPANAEEGAPVTLSLSGGTDPSSVDAGALHYAFDTDGDGSFDVGDGTYAGSGTAASATFAPPDDGTLDVGLRVIDKDGSQSTYTGSISVANVPPAASVTASTSGSSVSLQLAAVDPSSADAASAFEYAIDWGDGQSETVNGTTATHAYAPGSYTVSVVAIDKDGGRGAARMLDVTVAAAPQAQQQIASSPPAEIARVSDLSVRPRCVKTARSVTIRYTLNLAAAVRVGIQRRNGSDWRHCPPAHGVKKPTHKPVTYSPVTSKQVTTRAGGNTLVVASRARGYALPLALITKGRKLRPGTYLVTLTTLDNGGRPQATAKVKFWVVSGAG